MRNFESARELQDAPNTTEPLYVHPCGRIMSNGHSLICSTMDSRIGVVHMAYFINDKIPSFGLPGISRTPR